MRAQATPTGIYRIGLLLALLALAAMALLCPKVHAAQSQSPETSPAPTRPRPKPTPHQQAANQFLAHRGLTHAHPKATLPPNRLVPSPSSLAPSAASPASWALAGPTALNSLTTGLTTGRISALAFDPSDPSGNHLYLGTTGAGLWKSQNAAATTPASIVFQPITDNLGALSGALDSGLSIGAITVQPGATGTLLAGLGDPNDALDSYYGAGLLRSTDNGQTWSLIQQSSDVESGLSTQDYSFLGEGFAGFAWSTSNTQLVVAALSQAYEGTLVNATQTASSYQGLYYSLDAGATWHLARITDPSNSISPGGDIQGPNDGFALPDGNAATSVVWNPIRQLFFAAVRYHGYYQSSDGQTWTRSFAQPGSALTVANCPTQAGTIGVAGCPIFRGTLAVNPQTGDTFAWSVDLYNQDQGIWRDACAVSGNACTNPTVTFATRLATTALEISDSNGSATIENGDYNLTLAAIPSGPGLGQDTLLFAGGNDLWKCSLANSCQWRNTTNTNTCNSAQVGEYQHATAQAPANSNTLIFATDSGLWRSQDLVAETGSTCATTDATHFQNLNASLASAGSLAEISSLAQPPANAATMLAGLGALGAAGIVNGPATAGAWNQVLSGEGGPVAIDPASNLNSWYVNNQAGVAIFHCSSSSLCTAANFGSTPAVAESQVANDGLSMTYPAPFLIDPLDHTQLLIGTCRLWRGPASGSGWNATNAISPILDGTANSSTGFCAGNATIRSIAALPITGGGEILYVGMAGLDDGGGSIVPGHLFSATLAANGSISAWSDLTSSPVLNNTLAFNAFGYDLSAVYIDPHDATGSTVYAAISAFASPGEPLQQIYRSSDAGLHWTAIHANLPNAPINDVLVDPQDPNSVYVATDVGVYLTRTVTTCSATATNACWAAYGSGLPLAPVTTLAATNSNAPSLTLTAGTYGRGIWQIPAVTAGATLTTATLSPTSLTFAARTVGTASASQSLTLKNTGNAALTPQSVNFTGSAADYAETDTCTGTAIAKNASCTLKITFTPTQAGTRNATLVLAANVAGGQLLVPLTGSGLTTGSISLLPTGLAFGSQPIGKASAAQSFSLQNTGGTAVTLTSVTVSAPFTKTAITCGSSLAAGAACAISVAFNPTQAGAAAGSLTIVDSVGTQAASLTGTGILAPTDTLSTLTVNLTPTVIGQTSPPQVITLTNSGGLPLTAIGLSLVNTGNNDFSALSNCGGQLAAGASCGITIQFTPSLATTESATLTISDALRSQPVRIFGLGLKPPLIGLSATSLAFPNQQINLPSAAKSITLTNKGGSPLAQPSFSISGPNAASFAIALPPSNPASTCTAAVAASATCVFPVLFTPTTAGLNTATLTIATSSPGVASVNVALSGTGLTPPILTLSPAALNFGTVVLDNSSDAFDVVVTNSGQVPMSLPTFSITGPVAAQIPDFALNTPTDIAPCTAALNPAASCNIQVIFSPSVLGTESATLVVTAANAIPSTATVSLTGAGSAAILLQASATALSFPSTPVGTSSTTKTFTLSNIGKKTANSLALALAGPYALSPSATTCKTSLAAAAFCTVGIIFNPTANGDQPGSVTASVSNQGINPIAVALDGSGVAVGGITVNPTQFTFGSVVINSPATTQTLTVTNSGQAALSGLKITVSGDFSLLGNQCQSTLAAGFNCTAGVSFTPSTTGIRTGTLSVTSSSAGVVPSVVPLTGNGIPAGSLTASPAVASFGTLLVGQTSAAQTITLSNAGATTLAGLQFRLAGDYGLPSNACASQLAATSTCTFTVNFSPSAPGTRIGSVTISSTNPGFIPLLVGLTGNGLPTAQLVVSPLQLAFPSVTIGDNSAPLQIKVSNPGTGTLAGLSFSTASPFSIGSGACGASLPPAGSCTAPVTFTPRVLGPQSGAVSVSTTSLGVAPVSVALTGAGLGPPAFTWTPSTLTFVPTTVLTPAPTQALTLSNFGGSPIAGLTLALSGAAQQDFTLASTTCGQTLPAGATCTAVVSFTPSAAGGRQAYLTASSSTSGVAAKAATLSGTGLTPAAFSIYPARLTFPATLINQSSSFLGATLKNTGQSAITALQINLSSNFVLSPRTTCAATLPGGASCVVDVFFSPTSAGAITGSLTASSSPTQSITPVTLALSGTGSLPPGILTSPQALVQFPTTGVNQSAPPVPVTITNQGSLAAINGLALSINAAGLANGFSLGTTSCTATLAPLASCTANVNFLPTHAPALPGALSGALFLTSSNGVAPVNLALAGFAFDFSLFAIGSSSKTVIQGQTAFYSLAVTPLGATSGTIAFTCGTLPANAFCLFNPPQLKALPANLTSNIALGIATGKATSAAQRTAKNPAKASALLVCFLLTLPFAIRNRKRLYPLFPIVLLIAALSVLTSCAGAGGSTSLIYTGGGTPPGTYPVVITATSAGVTRTARITLVVN